MDNYEMDTWEKLLDFFSQFSATTLSLHRQFRYPTLSLHQPYIECFFIIVNENFSRTFMRTFLKLGHFWWNFRNFEWKPPWIFQNSSYLKIGLKFKQEIPHCLGDITLEYFNLLGLYKNGYFWEWKLLKKNV